MKIGRNLVNFQQAEARLRIFLAVSTVSGLLEEIPKAYKKQLASVSKLPLGELANRTSAALHAKKPKRTHEPTTNKSAVTLSLRLDGGKNAKRAWRKRLKKLAEERNKLVHHMLASFNPDSEASCEALGAALDVQLKRVLPTLEEIRALAIFLSEVPSEVTQKFDGSVTKRG